jgi:hypothetical protein
MGKKMIIKVTNVYDNSTIGVNVNHIVIYENRTITTILDKVINVKESADEITALINKES